MSDAEYPDLELAERIRRGSRPTKEAWEQERLRQINEAQRAHREIEFGRQIGIELHWLIVKPIQILWWIIKAVFYTIAFFFEHAMGIMFLFIYAVFGGAVILIIYLWLNIPT